MTGRRLTNPAAGCLATLSEPLFPSTQNQGHDRFPEGKTAVLGNLAKQFVQNIFEGSPASLIQHLTDSDVGAEELTQICKIIDDALAAEGEDK